MLVPDQRHDEAPAGLSRRALLRGVAWAAPVVVVATAAPAASASGGDVQIEWTNFTADSVFVNGNEWGGVTGNFTIQRVNDVSTSPDLTELTVSVTFESRLGLTGVVGDVDISGSEPGWTVQSASVGATYTVYTFVWSGTMAPYGNSGVLDYDIPTTIVAEEGDMVPYSVSGFADSPEVTASITASVTVTE